jgi:hypothetical protein
MNKYVIFSAIVSGILTWIFMYIDARLFDTPKTKFTYFKGVTFVASLVAGIVYFMAPTPIPSYSYQSAGAMVAPIGLANPNDMLTGMPPF